MSVMKVAAILAVAACGVTAADPQAYDYIVIGSGAGGSPVASKLAQAGKSVLLLEAGPDDSWKGRAAGRTRQDKGPRADPLLPNNTYLLMYAPDIDDAVMSEPVWQLDRELPDYWIFENVTDQRVEFMPRARIVGGCTMHNWMIYLRPSPHIIDSWATPNWDWATLFPKFRAIEHNLMPNATPGFHGDSGPCYVSSEDPYAPKAALATVAAAVSAGIPFQPDFNGGGSAPLGYGPLPKSVLNGTRFSASRAFLTPGVRALPNFHLLTESTATKILFGMFDRAEGVRYRRNGTMHEAKLNKGGEVIVSAGAFRTPQLLIRSGVGPRDVLWGLNMSVRAASPNVGRNLQDHLMVFVYASVLEPGAALDDHPSFGYDGSAHGGFVFSSWCKRNGCKVPDLQFMCGAHLGRTVSCAIGLVAEIQSAPGFLTLHPSDPVDAYPRIYPNYLGARVDVERLAEGLLIGKDMLEHGPPGMFGPVEAYRSWGGQVNFSDPNSLREYVREVATTIYHPVGTARMGSDRTSVVDEHLRVRGVTGVRVADASVMPTIPNVNTDAVTRVIGFHLADLILEGQGKEL